MDAYPSINPMTKKQEDAFIARVMELLQKEKAVTITAAGWKREFKFDMPSYPEVKDCIDSREEPFILDNASVRVPSGIPFFRFVFRRKT